MAILVCGYGLIGSQRVSALLKANIPAEMIFVLDPSVEGSDLETRGIKLLTEFQDVSFENITHSIVAMPHKQAVETVSKLLDYEIKVLLEKPMGRNLAEAEYIFGHPNSKNLSIGFNYRFMPGVERLHEILKSKSLGTIHSIRIDLGHGGRPEDKKSWKLDPEIAGGGVMLDPGVHVIDLLNYLLPQEAFDYSFEKTILWDGFWNTGIEEHAVVIGKIGSAITQLSFSVVTWKTRFSVEIIGSDGYAHLSGRGRSDGPQVLRVGKRWGWMSGKNQSDTEEILVNAPFDDSIFRETEAWLSGSIKVATAQDGLSCEMVRQKMLKVSEL